MALDELTMIGLGYFQGEFYYALYPDSLHYNG